MDYEDFDAFKDLNLVFPFERKGQADRVITQFPEVGLAFMVGTPHEAFAALSGRVSEICSIIVGAGVWMATVTSRLDMAQALVDVTEAAALCRSIIAVDFKARRRM